MHRKDKAMAARHEQVLRELVKKPENKICADCKKNDTRWASWNLGVFVCIRCSGIHRSMGVHISRIKSVDLDSWGEREMESIMKWGNHRANLYWEAHLRPGHLPPDHKMDSFIRSKYEARKWAREGPVPEDPSVLESANSATLKSTSLPTSALSPLPQQSMAALSRPTSPSRPSKQSQGHQLLSATAAGRAQGQQRPLVSATPVPTTVQSTEKSKVPQDDLFSLDFHSPPPNSSSESKSTVCLPMRDVKQDILSLFGKPLGAAPAHPQSESVAAWNSSVQQTPFQSTSMVGSSGTGMWGVQSGWNASTTQSASSYPTQQSSNIWDWSNAATPPSSTTQPHQQVMQSPFEGQAVWGDPVSSSKTLNDSAGSLTSASTTTNVNSKTADPFGDIWGDFK